MSSYNGNTQFVIKGAASKLTLRDVFSDVFKKHSGADAEKMLMSGMSTTTPAPQDMLREWQKPWLFIWMLGACVAIFALCYVINRMGLFTMTTGFIGTAVVPLTFLVFTWELNIPRNIPVHKLLFMFFAGGVLSLLFTGILIPLRGLAEDGTLYGDIINSIVEETGKLAAIIAVIKLSKKNSSGFILTGILIGSAIGNGFSAFEDSQYYFNSDLLYGIVTEGTIGNFDTMLGRAIWSPVHHGLWAALYGGALFYNNNGSEKFSLKRLLDKEFILYFLSAIALHTFNNYGSIFDYYFYYNISVKLIIEYVVGFLLLLSLINKGVKQVVDASNRYGTPARQMYGLPLLYCVSGVFAGQSFPLVGDTALVMGRDAASCNMLFPSETPGISRRHCTIKANGSSLILIDNGSSQGTYLDGGTRLSSQVPVTLNVGQRFYLATQNAMFEVRQQ